MSMIEFTVMGNPLPKERVRVVNGHAFTPRRTKNWERRVRGSARRFAGEPLTGPLSVTLTFYRQDHRRCDTDNLSKAVLDALNGVAYLDDSQIVELHLRRYVDSDAPRVRVQIEEAQCHQSDGR